MKCDYDFITLTGTYSQHEVRSNNHIIITLINSSSYLLTPHKRQQNKNHPMFEWLIRCKMYNKWRIYSIRFWEGNLNFHRILFKFLHLSQLAKYKYSHLIIISSTLHHNNGRDNTLIRDRLDDQQETSCFQ